jgi:branched-chain amino acid transport system permease protein
VPNGAGKTTYFKPMSGSSAPPARPGASWAALLLGLIAAAAFRSRWRWRGLFSLRMQSIFFVMVTPAVAYAFNVLASQLSGLTGGEDGRSFKVADAL